MSVYFTAVPTQIKARNTLQVDKNERVKNDIAYIKTCKYKMVQT